MQQRLEEIQARGQGREIERDEFYPDPLITEDIEVLPNQEDDPTDELGEIQESLGVNPKWSPNLTPLD